MVPEVLPVEAVRIIAKVRSWQEAVQQVGDLLQLSGRTTADYTAEMIANLEAMGPYIVTSPGIALAHARPSAAVLQTGFALLRIDEGVDFGSRNDPVRLLFGFSAFDNSSHIELLKQLAGYLTQPSIVNSLLQVTDEQQIRSILGSQAN